MGHVTVLVLHRAPPPDAGPLTLALDSARRDLADRHVRRALAAAAATARIVASPADDTPFGARLRSIAGGLPRGGLIVLGSGSIPLATTRDWRRFVGVAASGAPAALTNNRYSGDVVALGRSDVLEGLPDLPSDNTLPRWLEEVAGVGVDDLGRPWRLAVDVDSPADVVLLAARRRWPGRTSVDDPAAAVLVARLDMVAAVMADRRAELLVAGRTSARDLAWLETGTACRVRAVVEERGLRASSRLALCGDAGRPRARPPASLLGRLLDLEGPAALGDIVAALGEAAVIDSRVLLAHRLGPETSAWPTAEDRFASDLLLADRIRDPWLRALTTAARDAASPILLGGHTLVGPGLRLVPSAGASG